MKNLLMLLLLPLAALVRAEPIGEVDTVFQLIGPDHKIVVDAHDDPKVGGVTCYVARAKTGVIEGSPQNSVTAVPVDRTTPIPVK